MDYLNSEAAQKAHVFLPTTTLYESGGVYINQEARAQVAQPAYSGGIPITQIAGGEHPPRIYGEGIPGDGPAAAWQLLANLIENERQQATEDLRAGIWEWLTETVSGLKDLAAIEEIPDEGVRIYRVPDTSTRFSVEPLRGSSTIDDSLELLAVEQIFGTEALSCLSDCLTELAGSPAVWMHADDADELNLADGDRVSLELARGNIEAILQVADKMAAGTLVIPRHKDLNWQIMETGRTLVPKGRIKKIT